MLSTQNIWVVAVATGIFTLVFLAMGLGLMDLRGWARSMAVAFGMPGIVIYSLKIIVVASDLAGDSDDGGGSGSVKLIVLAITITTVALVFLILRYLTRPKVIMAFEAREVRLTKKKIRNIEMKIARGKQLCNEGKISKAELAQLKSECLGKEKALRARIRHLDKVRLARERKHKEAEDRAMERWEEKQVRKEDKRAEKEERKARRDEESEEEGEEGKDGDGDTVEETEE